VNDPWPLGKPAPGTQIPIKDRQIIVIYGRPHEKPRVYDTAYSNDEAQILIARAKQRGRACVRPADAALLKPENTTTGP
jgi:hypothetical protein